MFHVLHNIAVLAGGAGSLRLEKIIELWKKVDAKTIAEPPKGGSKGYQALLTATVMKQMLGDDYEMQMADAAIPVKANLRSAQGLL